MFILFATCWATGAAYSKTTVYFLDLFERAKAVPLLRAAIVGGAVGLPGWFLPDFVGPGDNLIQELLIGSTPLLLVLPIWSSGGSARFLPGWDTGRLSHRRLLSGSDRAAVGGLLNLDFAVDLGNPIIYVWLGCPPLCRGRSSAHPGVALVVEMTAITNQLCH